ncbi:DUF1206 domain-containing protein [Halobacillus litoralis]|uniref:DUF1206 domain-containing protein n=1 Tax=Halobacillus litoralis TaxID=45668 RepID=A0A845FCG2_9BACI|nr:MULTISPECIES: DUF1206 domain-containing protein [Halobacillus]MEC3885583.1 DUF1206 domain-containing protein [Halobacillus sp. HZG1]MYL71464.1 DUF1206 domain-containing protein [Halobacillus litoralis]
MASTMATNKSKRSEASEEIKPWVRRFGRIGYMAKGIVYALIGILTLMAAIGVGGKTTGTNGLFRSLAGVAFGEILLWIIGIGLVGYISWLATKSIMDPNNEGTDGKGLITRFGYIVGAVIYGSLAFNAIKIALNAGSSSGNSEQTLSAKLLSQPFGQWLVGLLGAIVIGYGLYEIYQGSTGKFMKKMNTGEMDRHKRNVAEKSGKFGLSARGIVLGLIGFFFIQTALTANPDEAKGLDGALSEIAQQPFGQILLGIAAVGLVLYGVYQMVRGRYARMNFGKK